MYSKDINDVYKELDTSEKGLTINEVNKRLNIYDKNIIKEKKKGGNYEQTIGRLDKAGVD